MKPPNQRLMFFLIMVTSIPLAIALDEYAPSMPHMVKALHTTNSCIQLSISLYMFSAGIACLFWGPLADRFGRRKVILISIPIFFIGSFLIIFAHSVSLLLAGRVFQGIGLATCAFIGSAIMADIYKGRVLNKAMAYFSATYSLVPIVAPLIGGILQEYFGWQANFIFMFLLILFFYLLFALKLPETHKAAKEHSLNIRQILRNYITVFSKRNYLSAVSCMMLVWSIILTFSIVAPFLLQNVMGVSAFEYGLLALFIGVGYTLGSIINSQLLRFFDGFSMIKNGLLVSLVFTLLLLGLALSGLLAVWSIILLTFIIFIGAACVYPNAAAVAVAANPSVAGTATALLTSVLVFGISIITTIITFFKAGSVITLSGIFLTLVILCLCAYALMDKKTADCP